MKVLHQQVKLKNSKEKKFNYVELLVRIVTGLFLIFDGVHILSHTVQIEESLRLAMSFPMAQFLIIFIGVAHLLGGAFIVLGLLTRIVILLQIPAILAEMFYIQPPNSFLGSWEILASTFLWFLLIFLYVKNSGKFSMDYYRIRKNS